MELFSEILQSHTERYPLMEPQDIGKLIYQSEFGPRHLNLSLEQIEDSVREEWATLLPSSRTEPEMLGGDFCRLYLRGDEDPGVAAPVLARLVQLSMDADAGSTEGLQARLDAACRLNIPQMRTWAERYRQMGYGPVRHSRRYNEAYRPHYRVVRRELAQFYPLFLEIGKRLAQNRRTVIAIDGRCGSGKSWLADRIARMFPCNLIHMDDFYLPKACRSPDWQTRVGGNMDLARFRQEVAQPLQAGVSVAYRAFSCQSQSCREKDFDPCKLLTVVEGSYSLHPAAGLRPDISIVLTCSDREQEARLRRREGDYFPVFVSQWIPMAERYLQSCDIGKKAMLIYDTSVYADQVEIQEEQYEKKYTP